MSIRECSCVGQVYPQIEWHEGVEDRGGEDVDDTKDLGGPHWLLVIGHWLLVIFLMSRVHFKTPMILHISQPRKLR
jgi:hypothetical protein